MEPMKPNEVISRAEKINDISKEELHSLLMKININPKNIPESNLSVTYCKNVVEYLVNHRKINEFYQVALGEGLELEKNFIDTDNDKLEQIKARLYNVPYLPPKYIERSEYLTPILDSILQGAEKVSITGVANPIGIQGMGGIGKSILAIALARSDEVRSVFKHGIVWISLGQEPNIHEIQSDILEYFGIPDIALQNPKRGKKLLNKNLANKKILLIVDDVWRIEDLSYFDVFSSLLITTRHLQIAKAVGAKECEVGLLSEQQSLELLCCQSDKTSDTIPAEASEILEECGGLPLAISIVGAMLKGKPSSRWRLILQRLQNAELQKISNQFTNYPYPNLFKALHVSVEFLPLSTQRCYLELLIFPEETPIPESVLAIYWRQEELDGRDALEVVDELLDSSLIFRHDENSVILHDLQRDYLHYRNVHLEQRDQKKSHQKLIDAYKKEYPSGWNTIPANSPYYFYRYFSFHLEHADNKKQAEEIAKDVLYKQSFLPWSSALICAKLLDKKPKEIAFQLIKTNKAKMTLVNCLKLLRKEAKEDARRLIKEHNDFHIVCICIKLLGEEAKDDARLLIKEHQDKEVICSCIKLLGEEAKDDARRLIKEHQEPQVICSCIKLLGEEVKDDARRLIKEHQSFDVICSCLNLLREEAKDDARHLIKEHQEHQVICSCLKLLGEEAKNDARRLIKEHQDKEVICNCIKLLGEEAKDDARRLIKEHQSFDVICSCLKLLGEEAKDDARRLIKEHQDKEVICNCIKLLGEEAKDDARRLIKEHKEYQVICSCLKLLGEEAKDDAQRLIKEHQDKEVICSCLKLLGEEAKDEARRLIKEHQSFDVICSCLKLLGEEAKDDARRLIKERREPQVICSCLNVLGEEAKDYVMKKLTKDWPRVSSRERAAVLRVRINTKIRRQRAFEVLDEWRLHSRVVVTAALMAFDEHPKEAKRYCKHIMSRWEKDISYCIKKRLPIYTHHIVKAMRHPELLNMAKFIAKQMKEKENNCPGSLGEALYLEMDSLNNGETFPWIYSSQDD
ncbi:NB-ARC domain-containing protein [Candidatus Uabimicrobium sp. HlEnr_7]|uniref:NB-ARC domain-containing protein n=1 Tax=Candidatus Uabimicrobium helgolandensis TaxID=3095367 RepID=UPI0035580594